MVVPARTRFIEQPPWSVNSLSAKDGRTPIPTKFSIAWTVRDCNVKGSTKWKIFF